jgi:hypothetical protein
MKIEINRMIKLWVMCLTNGRAGILIRNLNSAIWQLLTAADTSALEAEMDEMVHQ